MGKEIIEEYIKEDWRGGVRGRMVWKDRNEKWKNEEIK